MGDPHGFLSVRERRLPTRRPVPIRLQDWREVYDAEVEDDGSAPQQQQEEAPPAQERPAARRGSAASEKQTKCIFAISNALGLTDAQRKAVMVEIAGVDSSKDLTSQQAKAVIDCLKNAQDGNSAQLDHILGEGDS